MKGNQSIFILTLKTLSPPTLPLFHLLATLKNEEKDVGGRTSQLASISSARFPRSVLFERETSLRQP